MKIFSWLRDNIFEPFLTQYAIPLVAVAALVISYLEYQQYERREQKRRDIELVEALWSNDNAARFAYVQSAFLTSETRPLDLAEKKAFADALNGLYQSYSRLEALYCLGHVQQTFIIRRLYSDMRSLQLEIVNHSKKGAFDGKIKSQKFVKFLNHLIDVDYIEKDRAIDVLDQLRLEYCRAPGSF